MKSSEQPLYNTPQSFEELAEFIIASKIRKDDGRSDLLYSDQEKSDMIQVIETIPMAMKEINVKPGSFVVKNISGNFPRYLGIRQAFIDLLNAELTRDQEPKNVLEVPDRREISVQQVVLTRQRLAKSVA